MIATEGTSGVQGYPLWDRDEVKSNADKMEKELEMGGKRWGHVQQLMKPRESEKLILRRET